MSWHQERNTFESNVRSVLELLDFDREIVGLAAEGLRSVATQLEQKHSLHSAVTVLKNRALMLERVREGDSLRPKYETIFNQCVVLLVSYFDSAVRGVFRAGVIEALRADLAVPVRDERLSLSWNALEQTQGGHERIFADLLIAQKDISFQDMQSIVRAFKDLLGVTLTRTIHTDNIILGQAARNAIVHASGVVDERMVKQVSGAKLRTLKRDVVQDTPLRFTPEEIGELANTMKEYVQGLCAGLDERLASPLVR